MILHIDMDAFFASVEQLDNPELRGKPVIIGVESSRSVVSTASYEARAFGVRSAMPVFQAKKLCPEGIFVRGRMSRYKELSNQVFSLLHNYSPLVEPVSIDEAYVDITGCEKIIGYPAEAAQSIQDRLFREVKLTCSIGVSPLKFLSKIASDMKKPKGITIIYPDQVKSMIEILPIRKVPGVGKTTYNSLSRLGIKTLGDVKNYSEAILKKHVGVMGYRLMELSNGIDRSVVKPGSERKSISTETTLKKDTVNTDQLKHYLLMQADEVARELRKKKLKARTVTLKITFADFRQITRRRTLEIPTHSARVIYDEASGLFDKEEKRGAVRLIGLGGAGLVPENHPVQGSLFDQKETGKENWDKAERVVDEILGKFGKESVARAVLSNVKKTD